MKMIIAYIRTECSAEVMRELYNAGIGDYQVHGIRSERPTFLYSTRPFELYHLPAALKLEVVCPEERCDEIIRLIARRVREIAVTALSPSWMWITCSECARWKRRRDVLRRILRLLAGRDRSSAFTDTVQKSALDHDGASL